MKGCDSLIVNVLLSGSSAMFVLIITATKTGTFLNWCMDYYQEVML